MKAKIMYPVRYKSLYIIAIIALLSACDDFLSPDSRSTFDQDYVFSTEEDTQKAINGIYYYFTTDRFTSRLSNNMSGNTDIMHGNVGAGGVRQDIWGFVAKDNNDDLTKFWQEAYAAIGRANVCIQGIQASELFKTSKRMKHMLGEAYALRAYWYSMLIYFHGDVPMTLIPPKVGDNFYLGKTDRNEILTTAINDMIGAEENMFWGSEAPYGIEQVNREAVLGLIARLALQRGGYSLYPDMTMQRASDYLEYYKIANTYAKKLMDLKPHTLNADFGKIFRNECEFVVTSNEDVLWEIGFMPGTGDVGWNIGIRVNGGTDAKHAYGSGNNYMKMTHSYFHSFDTLDQRLPVNCAQYLVDKDDKQYFIPYDDIPQGNWSRRWLKTPPGASTSKGTGINWPMIRYSDILLMYAETENEINGGPTGPAQDALRAIRQRAFPAAVWADKVDTYIANRGSKESFFNAIVDERAWEFGGECIRKYELIRWNLYGKKVAETKAKLKQMSYDVATATGTYAYLPDKIYWHQKADGTIEIMNRYGRPKHVPTLGTDPNNLQLWQAGDWVGGMYDKTTGKYKTWLDEDWKGYTDDSGNSPLRYIFPINQNAIITSQGLLKNDGYGFGG